MSPLGSAAPRLLLRQLRDLMARGQGGQEKLDRVVTLIASSMVADVCSIYLLRSAGDLELFATEGLKPEAVHQTRLRPGEGLVGLVAETAEPLNLSDAQNHPNFSYRPETGEDPFNAFLGVPILRAGRPVGVLVIQNRARRIYGEDEIEALQTIAMVLAEVAAGADFSERNALPEIEVRLSRPDRLAGRVLSEGLAVGVVVVNEVRVAPGRLLADDPAAEERRLDEALGALRLWLERILAGEAAPDGATREVLEAFQMLAQDRSWTSHLKEGVRQGLSAEAAVERTRSEYRARLAAAKDPYLREHFHDLEDLDNRLLRFLAHGDGALETGPLPEDAVLVGRNLGPSEVLELGGAKPRAILLEEGGPTSHATIVARAMGIPMIGRIDGLLSKVENGDRVIVDAETGVAHLRPSIDVIEAYAARISMAGERRAELARLRDIPCVTRDGRNVHLFLNAGLAIDMPMLQETGAEGVGLFRTEFQFMISAQMPRLDAQIALYRSVLDQAGDLPVVFRTLDIGSDKIVPYLSSEQEDNPALGWRAVRVGLDRPALMRFQLRALIAAAAGRTLRVMFPLVATIEELEGCRALLDRELAWARQRGKPEPARVSCGVMLEAPSLAFQIPALKGRVHFMSIGTNDLMQYFFAADRGNPRVADRYDVLCPAALMFLSRILEDARAAGISVSVCGEAAGRPLEAAALIALGFDRLSMPASGIGPVKRMALSLDAARMAGELDNLLRSDAASLRDHLLKACQESAVML